MNVAAVDSTDTTLHEIETVLYVMAECQGDEVVPRFLLARIAFMLQRQTAALKACIEAERSSRHCS
jgi:hypothetical protein